VAEWSPQVSHPPIKRRRRLLKALGLAVVVVAVLLVVVIAALQTPPARRFVQAKVTELLARQGIAFATDELRYNLFDLSTDLRGVRVTSPSLPDAPPFLVIDRVRVDLGLWQVVRGRYVIESARAEGVALHYFVNAEGADNLPRPITDPDAPNEPLNYLIADLDTTGASVRYENWAQDIDLELPDVSLAVAGNALNDRHEVTIAASAGTVRSGARQTGLERFYREQGYLNAEIDQPRLEFEGAVARVALAVREGPRFEVSQVAITGNTVLSEAELTAALPVETGLPFVPVAAENALQHIRGLYWERGYNDIRVTYQLSIDRAGGRAGVAFAIVEGRQSVVSDVRIAGNDETSDRLVREQLVIAPGQPLNLQALSRSRKNLYDSGAFSIADLTRTTATGATADDDTVELIGGLGPAATQKPVVVDVSVREVQPFQLRYGASVDSEGGLGGIVDASNHNSLGKARVLGVSARYDSQLRDGRVYLSQPTLRHWPIQTTASVYYREERNPSTQLSKAFTVERKGLSIQQEKSLANAYVWTYGYRYERGRTFDPLLPTEPGRVATVSPLTSTLVREARDEVLDASRGSFTSHALSFSPSWLGSDATFIKYYGQYSHYFPLQPERRKRFSNEILRPRSVFATSVRLGLSRGMGTLVPNTERFFAGGSTSLRGFEQNAVGPVGPDGIPSGGDAMLVLNNELRLPLISLLDGVTFVDVGNVFPALGDFSFSDLRKTAGVGLRLRTKWVLVRGDYGFVLDVRAGERKSRFYFSIGQAF